MASTTPFLTALASRRSVYALSKETPIPNARILELVTEALTHAPSPFNVRSTRAIVLFGRDHEELWEHAYSVTAESTPAAMGILGPKIKGLGAAKGTVCSVIPTPHTHSNPVLNAPPNTPPRSSSSTTLPPTPSSPRASRPSPSSTQNGRTIPRE
jgi:nitroreductase